MRRKGEENKEKQMEEKKADRWKERRKEGRKEGRMGKFQGKKKNLPSLNRTADLPLKKVRCEDGAKPRIIKLGSNIKWQ